jgi:hypothetical protein
MITEKLINDANEKVKSLCSENKKLWYCIYILICVSIVFGIILPESAILKPRANIRKQRYFDKFL